MKFTSDVVVLSARRYSMTDENDWRSSTGY